MVAARKCFNSVNIYQTVKKKIPTEMFEFALLSLNSTKLQVCCKYDKCKQFSKSDAPLGADLQS